MQLQYFSPSHYSAIEIFVSAFQIVLHLLNVNSIILDNFYTHLMNIILEIYCKPSLLPMIISLNRFLFL